VFSVEAVAALFLSVAAVEGLLDVSNALLLLFCDVFHALDLYIYIYIYIL
jgi:hypothetical protein